MTFRYNVSFTNEPNLTFQRHYTSILYSIQKFFLNIVVFIESLYIFLEFHSHSRVIFVVIRQTSAGQLLILHILTVSIYSKKSVHHKQRSVRIVYLLTRVYRKYPSLMSLSPAISTILFVLINVLLSCHY